MEKYISSENMAGILGISWRTLQTFVGEGLPCVYFGKRQKFLPSEVMAWVKANKSAPVASVGEAGAVVPGEEGLADDTTKEAQP